jgi:CDP-diacylglycerol pyrophosphatase
LRRSPKFAAWSSGFIALLALGTAIAAEPASKLWPLVESCIANQRTAGDPSPCLSVDTAKGYAILKDLRGATQYLLVATDRRWGIEDPHIEAKDAPNYFTDAWSARGCVAKAAGSAIPDSEISLAINSIAGRSDGQLHIHLDRLRPGISSQLNRTEPEVTLLGHTYAMRHIDSIADTNVFAMIEAAVGGAMGDQTIIVAGDPQGGFFVLNDHIHGLDRASGEELQAEHPRLPLDQLAAMQGDDCAGTTTKRE